MTGGEPFLLADIGGILNACTTAAPTTVLTNGMLSRANLGLLNKQLAPAARADFALDDFAHVRRLEEHGSNSHQAVTSSTGHTIMHRTTTTLTRQALSVTVIPIAYGQHGTTTLTTKNDLEPLGRKATCCLLRRRSRDEAQCIAAKASGKLPELPRKPWEK